MRFFCRRTVWSDGFFHFTFPWPGGCGSSAKTQKGATYGQRKYESWHRRKCRSGSLWIYCVSRFADSEVGRVGRARRVGQWFPEICFESFAQDLATASARSVAQESESQNAMQPARSCRAGFSHTGGAKRPMTVFPQSRRCNNQAHALRRHRTHAPRLLLGVSR